MDHAIPAALAAGRAIMAVHGTSAGVREKADRSPVTEADLRAHAIIVEVLSATGLPVLSEEGPAVPAAERQGWARYWLVDPLDGTKEFLRKSDDFTVNIALMARQGARVPEGSEDPLGTHAPVAGVLYVPARDRLYFAWQGGGAYRLERAGTFAGRPAYELAALAQRLPMPRSHEAFTIVASRSHASPETEAFIRRMREQHAAVELVSMGSALKICLVAEGAADVYPRYAPTMEWDTAAGHAIAQEAGHDLIDVTTDAPLRYNKHELVNPWFIVQ